MTLSGFIILPVLGILFGSFLGVVIHRGPRIWGLVETEDDSEALSLAWPPSHCPACKRRLTPAELIPVLGYFIARGRCRSCGTAIPLRYPVVEVLGLLGGLLAAFLFTGWAEGLIALAFFLMLIALSAIDHETGYLPDAMTLPLTALGFGAAAFWVFVTPMEAIWGWVIGWGGLALLATLYRAVRGQDGLGGGDAKLLGAGGTFIGAGGLPVVLMLAAVGALAVTLIRARGKVRGSDEIRFGPWLAGGIAVVFVIQTTWPGLLP